MRIEIVWIALVALLWGGWPLVSRSSGVGGPTGSLVLSVFSLVPIALLAWWQGFDGRPSGEALPRLALAGTMMGGGLVAFNLVANSEIDASLSIPVVDAAMLVVTATGAIWFFGEPVTPQKLVGLGLLLAGIAILRPG